jgi:diguanylate cyclase (GGDEF)-like protein
VPTGLRPSASTLGPGPLRPLVAFTVVAFGATAIEPAHTNWPLVGAAALLMAVLVAGSAMAPWRLLPAESQLLPALGALAVVALLRQAQGGATSGYSPLVALPLIWLALVAGPRAVLVASAATTAVFAIPLLVIGDPLYPAAGWRQTVLWTVVAPIVGLVTTAVVAEQRALAERADADARAITSALRALEGVADIARDSSSTADPRERICMAARTGVGAALVTICERLDGAFVITGGAGISPDLQSALEPVASLTAFHEQRRVFIPDVQASDGVSRVLIERLGVRAVVFEPIVRRGVAIGVLGVGWTAPRPRIDVETDAVIAYLAVEAGAAIERSELVSRLADQAATDELTELANRRAWDAALTAALAGEGHLCVAVMDIDRFKAFNDEHGHLAGDRLLRACAGAWSSELREHDLLARYGGEEFAVLVRGCRIADAQTVLERMRRATPGTVTCSLGVAERRPGDTAESLLLRADRALYRAKREGRDRLRAA